MNQYPGVIRTSVKQLRETIKAGLDVGYSLAILCSPMLVLFYQIGGEMFMYAFFSFTGLVIYLSQLKLSGKLTPISDEAESPIVEHVATVLIILYYNVIVFFATVLGVGLAVEEPLSFALIVAVAYPVYDAEMANLYAPISIAGAFVFTVAIIARTIIIVEKIAGLDYWLDRLETLQELRESSLQATETLTSGFQNFQNFDRRLRPL